MNFCQQMHDIDYIFTCINKRQQTTQNFMSQLRTNLIAYKNNLLIRHEFLFKIIYFGSAPGIHGWSPKPETEANKLKKQEGKLPLHARARAHTPLFYPKPPYCHFYGSSNPCPSSIDVSTKPSI